jgi:hypothetical protein
MLAGAMQLPAPMGGKAVSAGRSIRPKFLLLKRRKSHGYTRIAF